MAVILCSQTRWWDQICVTHRCVFRILSNGDIQPIAQEMLQLVNYQLCIPVSAARQTYPIKDRDSSSQEKTVFDTRSHGRFVGKAQT